MMKRAGKIESKGQEKLSTIPVSPALLLDLSVDNSQNPVSFTIFGEPASKANSRRFVRIGGIMRSIKSQKALDWLDGADLQIPHLDPVITGDVAVSMTIYYATRRPDLDESLILDALQGRIIKNDRQVKEKNIKWGLDKAHPRAEITVSKL
jgi:Holliday junction resolvase RusA-like endonuclease